MRITYIYFLFGSLSFASEAPNDLLTLLLARRQCAQEENSEISQSILKVKPSSKQPQIAFSLVAVERPLISSGSDFRTDSATGLVVHSNPEAIPANPVNRVCGFVISRSNNQGNQQDQKDL